MAFFKVGDLYRQKYLIESVVPFFQGELAIAVYEDKRYYLQSASLNRQAPLRAISQYRNLKLPQVIPYLDVFDEPGMLVFIRPYVEIRPLREIITTQELSEEQVVKWIRGLLHVEAVLRSKPMSMYLLLDLRNIGVDRQNELKVFFCGLEQIMVYESKLDWGTFIYSMLSGQFLDGPILKLPRNFKVSRPMARLIQKSFKEYTVPPVLEQVEIFENKNSSGGILSKFWGERKEGNSSSTSQSKQKSDSGVTMTNRPIYRAEQNSGAAILQKNESTTVSTDDQNKVENPHHVVIQERGSLVKEDDTKAVNKTEDDKQKTSVTTVFKEDTDENKVIEINDVKQAAHSSTEWSFDEEEPLVGVKDQSTPDQKNEDSFVSKPHISHPSNSEDNEENITVFQAVSKKEVILPKETIETTQEEKDQKSTATNALVDSEEAVIVDKLETKKEESAKTYPEANQTTVTVSPALAQLEGQDLSQSFVLKLNKQQEELEKEQEERLRKMREEYERRERELIEQHRKKLEEEQKRLLEEQRKKLEQQQEELLKLKLEELARLEKEAQLAKERKEKEKRRKAKLAEARKQFEKKQKLVLEQEEQAYQKRQEELLAQLHAEYEQRKINLLQQQEEEYQTRTKAKLAELTAEWERVEDSVSADNLNEVQFEVITNKVTEEPERKNEETPQTVFQTSTDIDVATQAKDDSKSSDESKTKTELVTQAENEEIESVFSQVVPVPETIKETKKQVEATNEDIKAENVTKPVVKQAALDKQEQLKKVDPSSEATESEDEIVDSVQTNEAVEELGEENTTAETENGQEASGEDDAPKKKRRRRRRRRKKKPTEGETLSAEESSTATTSMDSAEIVHETTKKVQDTTQEVDPIEAERRRRELELQQMERELLEMEQREAQKKPEVKKQPEAKKQPEVKKQEMPKVNKVQKEQIQKQEEKPNIQSPVVAKKPEVPTVKDTTEHATLAKQFEQYLKLFKRKK